MSAGEPEEVAAYQDIFDEQINADADYNVEIESVGQLRGAVPDPCRGRDARRRGRAAARADPGARRRRATSSPLEDMGFDIDELNAQLGESFVALGEYNGKHYGLPTNINLKSMVWYPKDDFDAAGYTVPETWDDWSRSATRSSPTAARRGASAYESEGSTGWPATDWMEDIMLRTAGADVYDQWYAARDPVRRRRGQARRGDASASHVQGRLRARWRGGDPRHRVRRRAAADVRGPAEVLAAPPGELHQQLLPGRLGQGRRRLRLVPAPADRPGGHAVRR